MHTRTLALFASFICTLVFAFVLESEILVWVAFAVFGTLAINEFTHKDYYDHELSFTLMIDLSPINTHKMKIQKSKFPVTGRIAPTTATGITEPVEDVSYISSDESVFTVEKDPDDPSKFTINLVGDVGSKAKILASADARIGAGVKLLSDELEIEVIRDEADRLNLQLDVADES